MEWIWADGWILMSIYLTQGNEGAQLHDIIAAADGTNHAIPTTQELCKSLTKFVQGELVTLINNRYIISTNFIPSIRKAYESKGGLFESGNKGLKWLKKSGIISKNNNQIKLSDSEVKSSYLKYIEMIHGKKGARNNP